MLDRVRSRPPVWPAVGLVIFVFFWIVASIYLALALALCAALLFAAHWAWTKLPELFEHGPDAAELKERDRRQRDVQGGRGRSR